MPFDGLTLFGITDELKNLLVGGRISKIYQPDKNDVVLSVYNNREEYKLLISAHSVDCRIHLARKPFENPSSPPMFCMLLRKYLLGGKIEEIVQDGLERILNITIKNTDEFMQPAEYEIVAEIMGKHSNIILLDLQTKIIIDSIKRIGLDVNRYREILPGKTYTKPPVEEKVDLLISDRSSIINVIKDAAKSGKTKTLSKWLLETFAGFSGISAQEIAVRAGIDHKIPISNLSEDDIEALTDSMMKIREDLILRNFDPCVYFSKSSRVPLDFWLFPMEIYKNELITGVSNVNTAVDTFFSKKREISEIEKAKHKIKTEVAKILKKLNQSLEYLEERRQRTLDFEKYRLWGEILSANLYNIKPGQSKVILPNFYQPGEEIEIPLNEKLSPSQNAQKYFNRYKKLQSTKNIVESRISKILAEIDYLESVLVNIDYSQSMEDLEEIQQELESQGYLAAPSHKKRRQKTASSSKPLQFKSSDGFIINVGKNNKQNDVLTFKKAKPDDIWLHAKNTPGSHVVIESSGNEVPETTLVEAAILAAHFSKSRNSSNVPVDYTYVKHVKKPSGAKPGFVIYYHQKTIYVTPDENIAAKLSF